MSGHSKWSTIHRQKEAKDAKRGQVFTKLARAITVAVQEGGGIADPDKNFKLRLAVEKAHSLNMPKDNIQRAIKRGTGEGEEGRLEPISYEGYGPGGVAVIIEASTDNKNRTSQEIKNIIEKGGGRLAGPGAVSYQFETVGLISLAKPDNTQEAMLKMIDLGAADVEEAQDAIEVYTKPNKLEEVKEKIEKEGFKVASFELYMRPKVEVKVSDEGAATKILNLMQSFEDQPDVTRVFANFDIAEEVLAKVTNG